MDDPIRKSKARLGHWAAESGDSMIMNNEGRVPTTDEMDETTPEDRPKLVVQCANCAEWVHFIRGTHPMNATKGVKCTCGSEQFVPRSLISERTFDPVKAKKESAAWLRKKKK